MAVLCDEEELDILHSGWIYDHAITAWTIVYPKSHTQIFYVGSNMSFWLTRDKLWLLCNGAFDWG